MKSARSILSAAALVLLFLTTVGGCKGSSTTIDVEKLPCKERRPSSAMGVKEGFINCMSPSEDVDLGGGMICKKGASVGVYSTSKTLRECWVKVPVKVDGAQCTGGVQFYPNGKLRRCQLSAAYEKNKLALPKGSWITWSETGDPRRLELLQPTAVGSYKCKGYMNYAWPSGKLQKCELAEPATIEGQVKKAKDVVCFEETGKLADCSKFTFGSL
jgi:hypothetical protein